MKKLYCLILFCPVFTICDAQIDLECNGRDLHSIYLYSLTPNGFYRIDSVDTSPTNPVFLVSSTLGVSVGISINNNLDSVTGPETMYYGGGPGAFYHFWNGTGWTNTNHTVGHAYAVNSGGTSNYIFNLNAVGSEIYRYDGTGNGTLLLSNLQTSGSTIYDIATDNQGNFYLFYTNAQKIVAYNPTGMPIDSFTTSGFPTGVHPGFAILGDRMYAIANGGGNLYEGIKTGNTINFTIIKNIALAVSDIATCPEAGNPLSVFEDPALPPLIVYPNPFSDELNIQISNNKISEVLFYDITSRKILQQSFLNSISINTEQLSKGIYIYEVRNKNGVIKKGKVVKDC